MLNNTSRALVTRLRERTPQEVLLCSIVKAELIYGAFHSTRAAENVRLLQEFFAPFGSLPFDDECAAHYGRIRDELERAGTPIGPNKLVIAATALAHHLVLVTDNVREFERVVGLQLENWM